MNSNLSVIIPTYKRQDSLIKLIRLLQQQEEVTLEIIVVDQNPVVFFNDDSEKILQKTKRVYLPKPNASTARNLGYLKSNAPYILFIDDDLIPEPDFCKKALDVLLQNNEISCLAPLVYNKLGKRHSLNTINERKRFLHPVKENLICIRETITAAVFFKSETFYQTGGFDEYLFEYAKTAEDQEFFLRILKKGINLWCAVDLDIFHDEGITGGCELRTVDYWITREKCIKSWTYRHKIHNEKTGKLSLNSIFTLCRSTFLNRRGLTSGISHLIRQIKILKFAIKDTDKVLSNKKVFYQDENYTFLNKKDHINASG